jgi:hypothetical protein
MITEIYPRIPWELVAETLGSAERNLATTAPEHSGIVVVSLTTVIPLHNAAAVSLCETQSPKILLLLGSLSSCQGLHVLIM